MCPLSLHQDVNGHCMEYKEECKTSWDYPRKDRIFRGKRPKTSWDLPWNREFCGGNAQRLHGITMENKKCGENAQKTSWIYHGNQIFCGENAQKTSWNYHGIAELWGK